jgi:hypothetical protein
VRATRAETARVNPAMGDRPAFTRSPGRERSRPYDARSCATSTISRTGGAAAPDGVVPPANSDSTSDMISSAWRERCLPRKDGMAQNPQMRSHPSATFT